MPLNPEATLAILNVEPTAFWLMLKVAVAVLTKLIEDPPTARKLFKTGVVCRIPVAIVEAVRVLTVRFSEGGAGYAEPLMFVV
jgi:hypothetical protein